MNARVYLKSYGWVEGEALQNGGLKKPILVKHKKDLKGLGHDSNDSDNWWEKLFDGQLKNLEVNQGPNNEVSIKTNDDLVERDLRKLTSPLYKMFVKGKGLEGTVGKIYLNSLKDDHDPDAKKANPKVRPVPSLDANKEKGQNSKLKNKKKNEKKEKKEKEKLKKEKLKKRSKEKESPKSKKVKSDKKRHEKTDEDDSGIVTKKRKRSGHSEKSSKKSK